MALEYADYVWSDSFAIQLKEIEKVDPQVANAINKHGIGTALLENGDYDFESGQLLEDLPKEIREKISCDDSGKLYELVSDIAIDYADFCSE